MILIWLILIGELQVLLHTKSTLDNQSHAKSFNIYNHMIVGAAAARESKEKLTASMQVMLIASASPWSDGRHLVDIL